MFHTSTRELPASVFNNRPTICSKVLHCMWLPPVCWCRKHLRKCKKTAALILSLRLDKFISHGWCRAISTANIAELQLKHSARGRKLEQLNQEHELSFFTYSHSSHTLSKSLQQVWNLKKCDKQVTKSESKRNAEPPVEYYIVVGFFFLHLLVFAACFWRPMEGCVFCYHGTMNVWQWHSGKCSRE